MKTFIQIPIYNLRGLTLDFPAICNKRYDPVKELTGIAHEWNISKQIESDGDSGIKTFSSQLGWNKCTNMHVEQCKEEMLLFHTERNVKVLTP